MLIVTLNVCQLLLHIIPNFNETFLLKELNLRGPIFKCPDLQS